LAALSKAELALDNKTLVGFFRAALTAALARSLIFLLAPAALRSRRNFFIALLSIGIKFSYLFSVISYLFQVYRFSVHQSPTGKPKTD